MKPASGKVVGRRLYLHVDGLDRLEGELRSALAIADEQLTGMHPGEHYNVVRFDLDGSKVAFLNYQELFEDPFPALKESWVRERGQVLFRDCNERRLPPWPDRYA